MFIAYSHKYVIIIPLIHAKGRVDDRLPKVGVQPEISG